MDPMIAAALIQGGSSLLGGFTSALGASGQLGQESAMKMQQALNQEMHKWSLIHSPSWEMAGLKSAGINPLLRYGQHGSPAPHAAMGVSQAVPINKLSGLADAIGGIGTSAADAYSKVASAEKTIAEIDKVGEEIMNLRSTRNLTDQQVQTETQRTWHTFAQRVLTWSQDELTKAEADRVRSQIENIDADTGVKKLQALMLEKGATLSQIGLGAVLDVLGLTFRVGESITNAPGAAVDLNNQVSGWIRNQLGMDPW